MNKYGHIGLALLIAGPLGLILGYLAGIQWVILTIIFAFITARVPDIDQRTEIIEHRGITHTIWFAIMVSLALATIITQIFSSIGIGLVGDGMTIGSLVADIPTLLLAFTGFFAGFVSHLFGDILTEAYDYTINPLWPLSNKAYTLGWTKAGSKVWNWGFLIAGIASSAGAVIFISL